MESNGSPNRIHISQHTAELIELSGKGYVGLTCDFLMDYDVVDFITHTYAASFAMLHATSRWLKQREDQVNCKGKGWMTTFWCEPRPFSYASSVCSISLEDDLPNVERPTVRCSIDERLVDWCVNVFMDLLNDIVEHRNSQSVDKDTTAQHENPSESSKSCQINRSADVARQLHDFVSKIAIMYGGIDRPFHCFERCCHVAMTAKRLLDQTTKLDHELSNKVVLTSDPLTHFAIVFSAIIHGVDQPLVAHEDKCLDGLRLVHLNDSKSANIACDLLMDNRFEELRACIFESTSELDSWRQTVVNLVKSTNAMRAKRWEESSTDSGEYSDTLISELLLQAADVSHTMQHFSIYKKWNHRLCLEFFMLIETDYPVDWWYENELSFIDRCIIPLARSLCKIGICGGRECLVYSQENRKEWTLRGRELIQEARLAQISRATATIE